MKFSMMVIGAILFIANGAVFAAQDEQEMEKCIPVDKDGNNLVRAGRADSGYNIESTDGAWIWVPVGECAKINAGDFEDLSPATRSKLHPSYNVDAKTIE